MKLDRIKCVLKAEVLAGRKLLGTIECSTACGCDLMSDVLAFTKQKTLLLTGLNNPQVIRTAEVADLIAIVFVRGKRPSQKIIDLADEAGIPLLCTELPLYEACGILWSEGLDGCELDAKGSMQEKSFEPEKKVEGSGKPR